MGRKRARLHLGTVVVLTTSLLVGSAGVAQANNHAPDFPIVAQDCPVDTGTNQPSCLPELRDSRIVASRGGPQPLVIGTGWWCVSNPHSPDGLFCKTIVWWCTDDGSLCGSTAAPPGQRDRTTR